MTAPDPQPPAVPPKVITVGAIETMRLLVVGRFWTATRDHPVAWRGPVAIRSAVPGLCPFGMIVGSAELVGCLPIVDHVEIGDPECIVVRQDATYHHATYHHATYHHAIPALVDEPTTTEPSIHPAATSSATSPTKRSTGGCWPTNRRGASAGRS